MANPRAEAEDKLGGDYEARVLEPSPPAVGPPDYTDDPIAPGEVPEGRELVSPVHNRGDLTWDEIVEPGPGPGALVRRALARRLEESSSHCRRPSPRPGTPSTRSLWPSSRPRASRRTRSLSATRAVASARPSSRRAASTARCGSWAVSWSASGTSRRHTSRFPRRSTRPPHERSGTSTASPARCSSSCVRTSRKRIPRSSELWPEHFDIAMELGDDAAGKRANFGASPGDESHDEPYLYVGPWNPDLASGELWNGTGFQGRGAALLRAARRRGPAADRPRLHARALPRAAGRIGRSEPGSRLAAGVRRRGALHRRPRRGPGGGLARLRRRPGSSAAARRTRPAGSSPWRSSRSGI